MPCREEALANLQVSPSWEEQLAWVLKAPVQLAALASFSPFLDNCDCGAGLLTRIDLLIVSCKLYVQLHKPAYLGCAKQPPWTHAYGFGVSRVVRSILCHPGHKV